jgi:hypothetical protein
VNNEYKLLGALSAKLFGQFGQDTEKGRALYVISNIIHSVICRYHISPFLI